MKYLPIPISALLMAACPLAAQTTASPVAATPPVATPSADRIAAARPVVDKLWSHDNLRNYLTPLVAMLATKKMVGELGYILPTEPPTAGENPLAVADADAQKSGILRDIIIEELWPVFDSNEAKIRDQLAVVFARQYTRQQLLDLDTFLTTPSGRAYATQWLAPVGNAQMGTAFDFVETIKLDAPKIAQKFKVATKQLPTDVAPVTEYDEAKLRSKWSAADQKAVDRLEGDVAGAESRLNDLRGRLELMKFEARLRAGEKLSAADQDYLASLRENYGKVKK